MIGETGHKLWHPPALGAASGFEIDRVTEHSPSNVAILAEGANDPPGAHMTYYDHPGGGGVFAASSILFSSALQYDPRLGAVVRNVIERFVGG
jgi:hypothetical protein